MEPKFPSMNINDIKRASAGLIGAAIISCGLPAASFAQNAPLANEASTMVDGQTKGYIKGALKFLAQKQHLDGSWSTAEGSQGYPIAMTGYTLLAFMAAGNLPNEGEYAKNVSLGAQYLLDGIQPDGLFRIKSGQYMYNHGIATMALAELYGETRTPVLRAKLQLLINVILKAQAPAGGWRYTPQPRDADVSVTVLQAVALRAAQEAGFAVPQEAIDKAIEYVKSCNVPASGGFSYQPGGSAGFARTAAAIYSLQVLGKYDDPMVAAGSKYLFASLKDHSFWAYGNYYAAPAQYMIGGDTWHNWYSQVKETLTKNAKKQGDMTYWDLEFDSRKDLGPVYFTAVAVHILAMPYHMIPLYQR